MARLPRTWAHSSRIVRSILVIAVAAPATQFVKRHRQLFPETPLLITGLEQRLYVASAGADETAVLSAIDFYAALKNIVLVLPATDHIAIVIGASPLEKYWKERDTYGCCAAWQSGGLYLVRQSAV